MGLFHHHKENEEAYEQVRLRLPLSKSSSSAPIAHGPSPSIASMLTISLLQVTNAPHKAALSHELIAAAASYEAAKAYEDHCKRNGKPESHEKAKEILWVYVSSPHLARVAYAFTLSAGFAGAFIDRAIETKGLDFIDRERAKRDGMLQACADLWLNILIIVRYSWTPAPRYLWSDWWPVVNASSSSKLVDCTVNHKESKEYLVYL